MKLVTQFTIASIVGCLVLGVQPSAQAVGSLYPDPVPPEVTAAYVVDSIDAVDDSLVENAAEVPTHATGDLAIDTTVAGVDVSIPTDPSNSVVIGADHGSIELQLPFTEQASDVEVAAKGVAVFDNNNGSATAPIVRDDGTIQINTIIAGPDAPTEYPYAFELPARAQMEQVGGSLLIMSDGKLVAGLAPAWAKDANGREVPHPLHRKRLDRHSSGRTQRKLRLPRGS